MKPLWRQMLENGVSKENIERCIITKSSKGSPYEEVSEVSGEQEISFAVNPYIRMTKIVPGLETDDTFLPEIAKTITCIEYDTGMDVSVIVRQEMRKEIESGCFGPDIRKQWIKLTRTQQSETLRNLYRFYGQRQEIVSFVYEVQMLIPGSVLFRHRKFPHELYVYVRKEKTMELEQKIHLAEQLFLPIYYTLQTAWDTPFLISDLTVIVQKGNQIAK